ncbi:thiopeptide-type bacteriocin biosynthesis protein [Staphylococcus aureus]
MYEIVTPIYKKSSYRGPKSKFQNIKIQIFEYDKDWFALHIHIDKPSQDTFIIDNLYPFVKHLKDKGDIDQYFLMRYIKQGNVLKLKIITNNKIWQIYSILKNWLPHVRQTTEVSDYEFVSLRAKFLDMVERTRLMNWKNLFLNMTRI